MGTDAVLRARSTLRYAEESSTPGETAYEVEEIVECLRPHTTYHYRLVAYSDGSAVAHGKDRTFRTTGLDAPRKLRLQSTARTTSRSASDNSRPLAPRSVANDRAGAVSAPIDFEACSKSRPQRCEARDGLTLAYLEVGQGRPFVLLHGYLMTAEGAWLWTGLAELAAPGRRVIMPDLRGHGASGTPHDPAAYPPDVLADDGLRPPRAPRAGRR